MKEQHTGTGLLEIIVYLTKIFCKKSKGYFILVVFVSSLIGMCTSGNVVFKQMLFSGVSEAVGGSKALKDVLFIGIYMGVFMLFTLSLNAVSEILTENMNLKLFGYLGFHINEKAAKIEPISYEDPEMLDDINKAYKGAEAASEVFQIVVRILTYYIPYFLFMGFYLFRIKPILFICIVIAFLPNILGLSIRLKYYAKLERTQAPLRRKAEYYSNCMTDREYFKETRLLGAFWFFNSIYSVAMKLLNTEEWKVDKKTTQMDLGIQVLCLVGYVGVICLLFYYVIKGEISIAIFAAVFSSVEQLFQFMQESVQFQLGGLFYRLGSIFNYMNFMNFPEKQGKDIELKSCNITLKNVSFHYPGSTHNSINHISLAIQDGETIAIVGENGAGKSTLVKLLMGIYTPTEGTILLDGEDIKELSAQSIYQNTSAVFQIFQKYKLKLSENIQISDLDNKNANSNLLKAIKRADIDINDRSFSDGLNTIISKEFGGVDLSGGQWQRLAIARGFFRNHHMVVLDEPTAAIDPIEETKIYKKFSELSKGKTSIIVTHRLGSAKIAKRILVLDAGKIVEEGTHEELLQNNGKYASLYHAQAKWYA